MHYRLRENLSYCDVDGHLIFFDVAQDRYFKLTGSLENAMRRFQAHEESPPRSGWPRRASPPHWLWTYNHERPNIAFGGITDAEIGTRHLAPLLLSVKSGGITERLVILI